jgi:hypothetical protein
MENVIFGPSTIKHGTTAIGKTSGGGSLTFLVEKENIIGETYDESIIPYAIEGTINKFEFHAKTITSDLILYNYGILTITNPSYTITLHNAKIFFPTALTFGTNTLTTFSVNILGTPDSAGKIITIT